MNRIVWMWEVGKDSTRLLALSPDITQSATYKATPVVTAYRNAIPAIVYSEETMAVWGRC